jgi:ubiquitin-protein ligase
MVSGYDVELINEDKMDEFIVKFKGPADSPYAGVIITFRTNFFLG